MKIQGLRSAYDMVGGIVHFGRMIDKIRLQAAGTLPSEYQPFLGATNPGSFDGRCCRFLKIDYDALVAEVLQGGSDESLFEWARLHGRNPSDRDVEVWNAFMQKRGWRDESSARLKKQAQEAAITDRVVSTFFDFYDADEGRPPRFSEDPPTSNKPLLGRARVPGLRSPWEKVGGIVHFGRMLDKIRLFQKGQLPPPWAEAKGSVNGFDGFCCYLLQVEYEALEVETLHGRGDDQMLQWAYTQGCKPSDEEIEMWNDCLSKRCWRDKYTPRLHFRLQEAGLPIDFVLTMFECIDLDEGRIPLSFETSTPGSVMK
jgi:Domain of unknown function (DUF5069)